MYIFCQPSGVACSASRVNSMTIHVPSSTALALGASSIMFATVMTDASDGRYTSSSFVSFYGLVGIGGLRRSQIRGRRVATSSDAVGLERLTQSDFVQFWINKIDGVVVCGSNPIDGGLSEAHRIRMSRTPRASRGPDCGIPVGDVLESRRGAFRGEKDGASTGVSWKALGTNRRAEGSALSSMRRTLSLLFRSRRPRRFRSRVQYTSGSAVQARSFSVEGVAGSTLEKSASLYSLSARDDKGPIFQADLRTPAYGEAGANVRSSRNFPEPKRNRGASSCPFTQRG